MKLLLALIVAAAVAEAVPRGQHPADVTDSLAELTLATSVVGDEILPELELFQDAMVEGPDENTNDMLEMKPDDIVQEGDAELDEEDVVEEMSAATDNNGAASSMRSLTEEEMAMATATSMDSAKRMPTGGYTWQDARVTPGGHYHLGPSRRRVGAGFGRRRRRYVNEKKVKAKLHPNHWATLKPKVKKEKTHKYMAKYLANAPARAKLDAARAMNAVKHLFNQRQGIKTGPTFFSKENLEGKELTTAKNVADVAKSKFLSGSHIESLMVPAGLCVELFTKVNYKGVSTRMCGPDQVMSLHNHKLLLPMHSDIFKFKNQVTNWDGHVASFKLLKWEYNEQPSKCIRSCGKKAGPMPGSIICTMSDGVSPFKPVPEKQCKKLLLAKPPKFYSHCPASAPCLGNFTNGTVPLPTPTPLSGLNVSARI
jgi:hypothetical protein